MTTLPPQAQADIKAQQARAQTLLDLERYPEAIRAAQEALARCPDSAPALCVLSWAQSRLGRADEAMRSAERACAAEPGREWGHRLRAIYHQERQEHAPAVAAAREAVRLAPRSPIALFTLSDALMHAGELDQAMQTALRMREVAPESARSHEMCGGVAQWGKRYAEAEAHYRRGLALDPERYVCLVNLGTTLLYQAQPREAIDCFLEAHRTRPQDERSPAVDHNLRVAVGVYLGDNSDTRLPTETVSPAERQRRWDSLPAVVRQRHTSEGAAP